jgi:hypothetical protein
MPDQPASILQHPIARAGFKAAWFDSQPGVTGGHEEGGFVVQDLSGSVRVVRWPGGIQNSIVVPTHQDCKIDGQDIIASFHTHPNTGNDFLQEPSETDKRAVRDDPDLKGITYVGEFVISQTIIYLITPDGHVHEVADTLMILAE